MHTVVSLFSGCGGLDLGFKQAGFDLLFATDHDEAAADAYRRNVDKAVAVLDVRDPEFHRRVADIGRADVVLGGFPCQGFSKAGPKKSDDIRNSLYLEMLATVKTLKPKVFLAENVDGIRQNFGGAYLRAIVNDFSELGYEVEYRLFDAVSFGLAQHRRRIFFVGVQRGKKFQWPTPTHRLPKRNGDGPTIEDAALDPAASSLRLPTVTLRNAIGDLPALGAMTDHIIVRSWPKKYEQIFPAIGTGQKLCNVRHAETSVYTWHIPQVFGAVSNQEVEILETIARNRRKKIYGDIPNGNPIPSEEIARLMGISRSISRELKHLEKKGYVKSIGDAYDLKGAMFCSGLFKRLRWNEPSPTVLTNFYNPRYFLHPESHRPLSLRECARIQGFPDDFNVTTSTADADVIAGYRMIGNAVPPPLGKAFAEAIMRHLDKKERSRRAN